MNESCTIDHLVPLAIERPDTVGAMSDLVRRAAAEEKAIYPLGGRTMLDLGKPPSRPGWGIDLRGLTQVIDYPARDMTVTVQAGITLAKLDELLRSEKQRLPIDVPRSAEATLGGAIATNRSGPRRLGFGTLRDYVIGISVVNDEGQEVKAGGRVVKNVAGYDLCKLHIGALGSLGIVTQVTLKLRPRPEEQALVVLGTTTEKLADLLDKLHGTATRPVCVELLNAAAGAKLDGSISLPEHPWLLIVGFEENSTAVAWQVSQLKRELSAEALDIRQGLAAEPLWQALTELPGRQDSRLIFKANLLPSELGAFCRQAAAHPELLLQAHAGNGIVIGHLDADLSRDQVEAMLRALRATAVAAQGNVVIHRCPVPWKETLPIWGSPRGDAALMRAVKENLDPRNIFNPGRFVQ